MSHEQESNSIVNDLESAAPRQKGMSMFRYKTPSEKATKIHVPIANSDIIYCAIQVVGPEGKTNLHSHTGMDGLWFVLTGRVRFYDDEGLVGEFGPHEGVFVTRGTPYWFESVGNETAEILQAEAIDKTTLNQRVDHEPRIRSLSTVKVIRGTSRPVEHGALRKALE